MTWSSTARVGDVDRGTSIPPSFTPDEGSYHVSLFVPLKWESTASTWEERPTAIGTPTGFAWLMTVPSETSWTGTVAVALDTGAPCAVTDIAGTDAMRPLLTAIPSAGSELGSEVFWPALTSSIPPPAISFAHDPPEPQA